MSGSYAHSHLLSSGDGCLKSLYFPPFGIFEVFWRYECVSSQLTQAGGKRLFPVQDNLDQRLLLLQAVTHGEMAIMLLLEKLSLFSWNC